MAAWLGLAVGQEQALNAKRHREFLGWRKGLYVNKGVGILWGYTFFRPHQVLCLSVGGASKSALSAGPSPGSCVHQSWALAAPPRKAVSRTPVGKGAGSAAKSHTHAPSATKGQVWSVLQLPKNERSGKKATQSNPSPIKSRHRQGKGTPC